jgi:hypothetical protein
MSGLQDQLLQSALDLAGRGLRVFPLVPGTKQPAIKKWQKLATTDETVIRQVWSSRPYNIGVATGGGILGLDVDMKDGKDGMASLAEMGVELNGFVVRTPTGGRHAYFLGPDVRNSIGRLGPGLDIRGVGGFLVGPGSRTEAGDYVFERAEGFSSVPPAIVHACVRSDSVDGRRSPDAGISPDDVGALERSLVFLRRTSIAIEGQGGDHTTYTVAAHLKDFGLSEQAAYDLLLEHWNDRCVPPWAPEDLRTKVRNAYAYGQSPAGIAHPSVEFGDVQPIDDSPPKAEIRAGRSWFRHGDAHGAVPWLYYNLLPRHGVGVLVADSQAGKTFLLIELARSLATGKTFFGVEPDERGATLFAFAGTEGSGLPRRLDALQEDSTLPISATLVGSLSAHNALTDLLGDLKLEAQRIRETFDLPVRMVVIETLSASGLLKDENDNAEAARAMVNLAQIGRALDALVVTSHHTPRNGSGPRGASAIPDNADYVIEVSRNGRSNLREIELTKGRDAEQRKLGTFTLVPVELGEDDRGRKITSMTISQGEALTDDLRASAHAPTFVEALDWALAESGEEMDDGRRGVRDDLIEDIFKDRYKGARSGVRKTYRIARDYCESVGMIEVAVWRGYPYVKRLIGGDDA